MRSDSERTVRELGGEVWAELFAVEAANEHWELVDQFVDVLMGVLARHTKSVIVNDLDLPVAPLPPRGFRSDT